MKGVVSELVKRIEDAYADPKYEIDSIIVDKETGEIKIACHVREVIKEEVDG